MLREGPTPETAAGRPDEPAAPGAAAGHAADEAPGVSLERG
jgi:hypothetical protein